MSSVKIKICGITNMSDAAACAEAGADYLGFVFYAGSPRYIPPARASRIVAALPPGVTPVGVFVNESAAGIARAAGESGVRIAQLSGDEPPEVVRDVGLPVIKVIRPGSTVPPAAETLRMFACMVDGSGAGEYGGSGASPDLGFAEKLAATQRLFLAGGLRHDNVGGRIARVRPFAVDVCSGTELRPGIKDRDLVFRFCAGTRIPINS